MAASWNPERCPASYIGGVAVFSLLYQAREAWAQDFEFIYLTWVELRGFEPLTSFMPFLAEPSEGVESESGDSQVRADTQSGCAPAASEAVCVRKSLG